LKDLYIVLVNRWLKSADSCCGNWSTMSPCPENNYEFTTVDQELADVASLHSSARSKNSGMAPPSECNGNSDRSLRLQLEVAYSQWSHKLRVYLNVSWHL